MKKHLEELQKVGLKLVRIFETSDI